MTLWVCGNCTARYAIGVDHCPQCSFSARYGAEEGTDMARITVHGGVTDQNAEGSEDLSPGSNSETLPEKPQTASVPSESAAPSLAGKTESHSATPARTGKGSGRASSTAGSVDASTTEVTKK